MKPTPMQAIPLLGGMCALLVVCSIGSVRASPVAFSRNGAGRLTGANYGGKSVGYTYDPAGNLTSRQFAIGGGGDSDHDGMDDTWELQYFGNLSRDGSGDFDGDGSSDLAEFLVGTLPNNAASVFKIIRVTPTPGVSALIEWSSVPGKTYHVQYKNSLSAPSWTDLSGDVTATNNTASKLDTTLAGASQRLYRVTLGTGGPAPPPVLSIARTNGLLLVSWPSSTPAGFTLTTATNLTPVVFWSPVTNVPADNGTTKSVFLTNEPSTRARFFRLQQ